MNNHGEISLSPLANLTRRMQVGGNKATTSILTCKAVAKLHGALRDGSGLVKRGAKRRGNLSSAGNSTAQTQLIRALNRCLPHIEVRAEFKSGTTVRVPKPIEKDRQESLIIRWLVESARNRGPSNASYIDKLSKELQDIVQSNQSCGTYKKLLDLHRAALANRSQLRT